MGGVIAFDLATTTGWAWGRLPLRPLTPIEAAVVKPPKPDSGIRRFGTPGCTIGSFLADAEAWGTEIIARYQPQGMILEAPILPRETSVFTARKLMGLVGLFHLLAHRHRITWVREVQPSSVKKHFCGSGAPGKEGVQRACLDRGWKFADDNEADSLAIWDYAAALYALERAAA